MGSSKEPADLCRNDSAPGRAEKLRRFPSNAVSAGLGCLCKARLRRATALRAKFAASWIGSYFSSSGRPGITAITRADPSEVRPNLASLAIERVTNGTGRREHFFAARGIAFFFREWKEFFNDLLAIGGDARACDRHPFGPLGDAAIRILLPP